ncbi:MAG: DUF1254 domain-containing protein [Mangrovibacterium sp.]
MKSKLILLVALSPSLMVGCNSKAKDKNEVKPDYAYEYNQEGKIKVNEKNFTIAETDRYFEKHAAKYGVNKFRHSKEYSTVENQVVIRENRDCLYSHAVVDVTEGATIKNPEWNKYAVMQVIDENQYTIDVLYPGQERTFTTKDLTMGTHVWLNCRTEVLPETPEGYADAYKHQNAMVIDAKASNPYVSKGFDRKTQDSVKLNLLMQSKKVNSWFAFGMPKDVDPEIFTIASAGGWAGLPKEDALYWPKILPKGEAKKSTVSSQITLPKPNLDYDKGGFMSVTAYDDKGWIATDNYALRDRNAERNADGSITFRFNSPGKPNNIDTPDNWTMVIRLYMPVDPQECIDYLQNLEKNNVEIEVVG